MPRSAAVAVARLVNAPMVAPAILIGRRRHLQSGNHLLPQIRPAFACGDGERQQSDI
jgi:hypothetical protein